MPASFWVIRGVCVGVAARRPVLLQPERTSGQHRDLQRRIGRPSVVDRPHRGQPGPRDDPLQQPLPVDLRGVGDERHTALEARAIDREVVRGIAEQVRIVECALAVQALRRSRASRDRRSSARCRDGCRRAARLRRRGRSAAAGLSRPTRAALRRGRRRARARAMRGTSRAAVPSRAAAARDAHAAARRRCTRCGSHRRHGRRPTARPASASRMRVRAAPRRDRAAIPARRRCRSTTSSARCRAALRRRSRPSASRAAHAG